MTPYTPLTIKECTDILNNREDLKDTPKREYKPFEPIPETPPNPCYRCRRATATTKAYNHWIAEYSPEEATQPYCKECLEKDQNEWKEEN